MEAIFLKTVNMSITAGVTVLFVLLFRLLFRKAPKKYCCILWMLVGLRLVCPITLNSTMSLILSPEPIPSKIIESKRMWIETGIPRVDIPVNIYLSNNYYEGVTVPVNYKLQILNLLAWIWLAGVTGMLLYSGLSYLLLRRRLRTSVRLEKNLWQSENVKSPFILGIFRPRIYLPFSLKEPQLTYVLAHERAHLKRGDHLVKPLGFLLLSVYWFNPVIWLAFYLLCRDLEQACDERAIRNMSDWEKKEYAESLFRLSVKNHSISACPVAFGEVGVKKRIEFVVRYQKPAPWAAVLAALGCIVAGVCLLTNHRELSASELYPDHFTGSGSGSMHTEGGSGTESGNPGTEDSGNGTEDSGNGTGPAGHDAADEKDKTAP